MRASVDPRLVEETVFLACRAAAARGDPGPSAWRHRALERGYGLPRGPDRERRFERVHGALFRRLGLSEGVLALLRAHPGLGRADGPLRIGRAQGRGREGADLLRAPAPEGGVLRTAAAAVLPETLADAGALAARLHRDLRKVEDLLDPAFGWEPPPAEGTPGRRETEALRYGAAWDAWTDGRILRAGLATPVPWEETERAFARAFAGAVTGDAALRAARALRDAPSMGHAGLRRLAADPSLLAGDREDPAPRTGATPVPGTSCPFCRFPTHDWVPGAAALPDALRRTLAEALPGWAPEQGICGQCLLLYRSRKPASATA
jgi:hypothetical protein